MEGKDAVLVPTAKDTRLQCAHQFFGGVQFLVPANGYTALNAASSAGGSDFPRLLARRRMPTLAFWLKKNFGGIASTGSSSEDKDAHPALGWSEVLQVKHAECGHGVTARNHTTAASPTVCWNSDGTAHDG
jgi:hypothetical protein